MNTVKIEYYLSNSRDEDPLFKVFEENEFLGYFLHSELLKEEKNGLIMIFYKNKE